MMPDDPDGVWSTVCDSYSENVHADIGEIVKLCRLYNAAYALPNTKPLTKPSQNEI
jgi:hypothetical protein